MASMIKGISILLYEPTKVGTDAFGADVYMDVPVTVGNVLIAPVSTEDIISDLQMYGKRAAYELCIPKDDEHTWEDRTVEFFGTKWRTFGFSEYYLPDLIPLEWNRKVKVERYG